MKIIPFYRSLLSDISIDVNADHECYLDLGDESRPFILDNRILVLPTPEKLKTLTEKDMAFHPVSENVLLGESEVLTFLKQMIMVRVTGVTEYYLKFLAKLAVDAERQKLLSPTQAAFLSKIPDFKKPMVGKLNRWLQQGDMNKPEWRTVSMAIRKGGKVGGKSYAQACLVTYPLRQQLNRHIFEDLKLESKERESLMALFDWVLPPETAEQFSTGSSASVAPKLLALLTSFNKIAQRLNQVFTLFENLFDATEKDTLVFKLDWVEGLDHLKEYYHAIPPLDGNTGEAVKSVKKTLTAPITVDAQAVSDDDDIPFIPDPPKESTQPTVALETKKPAQRHPEIQKQLVMIEALSSLSHTERDVQTRIDSLMELLLDVVTEPKELEEFFRVLAQLYVTEQRQGTGGRQVLAYLMDYYSRPRVTATPTPETPASTEPLKPGEAHTVQWNPQVMSAWGQSPQPQQPQQPQPGFHNPWTDRFVPADQLNTGYVSRADRLTQPAQGFGQLVQPTTVPWAEPQKPQQPTPPPTPRRDW